MNSGSETKRALSKTQWSRVLCLDVVGSLTIIRASKHGNYRKGSGKSGVIARASTSAGTPGLGGGGAMDWVVGQKRTLRSGGVSLRGDQLSKARSGTVQAH